MPTDHFLDNVHVSGACMTAPVQRDLNKTTPVTPVTRNIDSVGNAAFTLEVEYAIDVSPDSPFTGDHLVSVEITLAQQWEVRWRLHAITASPGCTITASSAYSAIYSTTGIKTDTLNLAWGGSDVHLVLAIEAREGAGGPPNRGRVSEDDTDSKDNAPWPAAGGAQQVMVIGGLAASILTPWGKELLCR